MVSHPWQGTEVSPGSARKGVYPDPELMNETPASPYFILSANSGNPSHNLDSQHAATQRSPDRSRSVNSTSQQALALARAYAPRNLPAATKVNGARSRYDFKAKYDLFGLTEAWVLGGHVHPDDIWGTGIEWVARVYSNSEITQCINTLRAKLNEPPVTLNAITKRISHSRKISMGADP